MKNESDHGEKGTNAFVTKCGGFVLRMNSQCLDVSGLEVLDKKLFLNSHKKEGKPTNEMTYL